MLAIAVSAERVLKSAINTRSWAVIAPVANTEREVREKTYTMVIATNATAARIGIVRLRSPPRFPNFDGCAPNAAVCNAAANPSAALNRSAGIVEIGRAHV